MEFEQNWVIVKPETFFPCRTPVLICDNKGNMVDGRICQNLQVKTVEL